MIKQTRFVSTVFLCIAFKLENIYLGVNLCGNFISGNLFLGIVGKIAKISTHNNIAPHSVYRYLKQIEGEIVACCRDPRPPRISIARGACQPPPPSPPPPGISVIFQLGLVPSGKNICIKKVVALYLLM